MRKGRKLELLVKEIKALKLPDATIKSPEFVKDRDTETFREVDIGVHYSSGEKDFFIALECRDWDARQNITWIEQLIAKKNSIGADVLIAVTSSSFTAPAKIKAFKNGIVLREMKKFSVNEIKKWMDETYIEIHLIRRSIRKMSLELEKEVTLSKPLYEYTFSHERIPDPMSSMEFIAFIADRDMYLRLRDRVEEMKGDMPGQIDFTVGVKPTGTAFINVPPPVKIQTVRLDLSAENIFLRAPVVSGFNYVDCDGNNFISEGYNYNLEQNDTFSSILIDSQTNKAKGELDFSQLTRMKADSDIIASITFKYTKPVTLNQFTIKT